MINILSELEQDALLEVLNMGMGHAADSLSQIVGEEVLLSIPRLFFLSRQEAFKLIEADPLTNMAAVRQSFTGPFHGSALLIYPQEKSLELVRALLHDQVALHECKELEQESLTEVGNIILNACLGSIANLMEIEILCELPEYLQGTCETLLTTEQTQDLHTTNMLLLYVDFVTHGNAVKGYVILVFNSWAISHLKKELASLLCRFGSLS